MSDLVSKLRLEEQIGNGYFGKVYRGYDPVIGLVAVKIFQKLPEESEEKWVSRKVTLLSEGQRLKQAESDQVVRVYQVLESASDDAILLVMEYCEGGCIQTVYETGPMRLKELRAILTDSALGLRNIHARGMLHRDIKPANILLTRSGHAKISDFGLVTDDLSYGYGSGKGYFDHLAYEVYFSGQTSIRSDVWAFGMTAYRLLHGSVFYSQLPRAADEIAKGGYALNLPWLPHVPEAWRRFIRRSMHDNPSRRLQSADDVLQQLARLPVEPNWNCQYSPDDIHWQDEDSQRIIDVNLYRVSESRFTWEATSRSSSTGRSRRLDGSKEPTEKSMADQQLKAFFVRRLRSS